ncbi:helix-turn-helix domain-containing protein [Streptomyces ipomoeae]|uniref:helix-turn-helix domain-containing protein n=1 Tax=Streptomyces ipomoeae TaxID=103232 RepID=UPI00099860B8|nr:helix-turn-helix domain-containing protein [Streptomyces ipomoeae]MDX2698908.1 helix-turn-helix domain-containing protein [Streptomyces ipomoeae]MDX2844163.1 helix-turn-helix domain-containing protein [Streptomyces ipomoeae]
MKESIMRAVNTGEDDTKLLTVAQAMEHLGIRSRSKLYDLILGDNPVLKSIKIGRSRKIPFGAVREYVLQQWKQESFA